MKHLPFASIVIATVLSLGMVSAKADETGPVPGLPWMHEGTLVTTRSYVARLAGPMATLQRDEKGEVLFNGKRYHQIGGGTADAGGLTQTVILAIDGDDIVLKTMTFTQALGDPTRNAANKGGDTRFVNKTRKNILCVAPDLLALETSDVDHGKIVSQVKWPAGAQWTDAIRIDKISSAENLTLVYERKTGLLLRVSSLMPVGNSDTQLTEFDLVSVRDLQIPWLHEKVPQAVRNMKSMRLAGQKVDESGFRRRPAGLFADMTLDHCADDWASFNTVGSALLPGMRQPVSSPPQRAYYGVGEFGGLWIGAEAAAHLQQGQVLDTDAATHIKTFVSRLDDKTITIAQTNRSTSIENTYDRTTGLMVETMWFDSLTKSRTTLRRENLN